MVITESLAHREKVSTTSPQKIESHDQCLLTEAAVLIQGNVKSFLVSRLSYYHTVGIHDIDDILQDTWGRVQEGV